MIDINRKIIFTTSWDDGSKEDRRVLELLNKYALKGTFYISRSIDFPLVKRISDEEIAAISQKQEVGAHTLGHSYLDSISLDQARQEIIESKKYIEDLTHLPVKMFCYPGGRVNEEIKKIVKEAGFIGARTIDNFQIQLGDPYLMGTTLQCYPFPLRPDGRSFLQPLQQNWAKISQLGLPIGSYFSWLNLAKNLFDYALKKGEIFHLWGHSWEIEKNNQWKDLEQFFKHIAGRVDVKYLNNSQTIEALNENTSSN